MKASWFWLKEFCDFSESPEEVRSVLLQLGFDVPSLTPVGGAVTGVVAALVEFVEKHPNADKLNKCVVFDGIDRFSVVCGALT